MSYQVLARKWRPRSFSELAGQAHVSRALINALDNARLHHAYLFTGTRGVGKTTIARILAKSLNCEEGISSQPCGHCAACQEIDQGRFIDLIEVDAASRTKVEDTRELLENVQYAPTRGRFKVYLIDEVHMLSNHSFNALLKTLEEPPPHVKFLLATTDPQKLPVTVLSRCLQFNLKRLPVDMISDHLQHILGQEQIKFDVAALINIARAADGSMRDGLSLLDQAIAFGAGEVRDDDVCTMLGVIEKDYVFKIARALAAGDGPAVLNAVHSLAEKAPDFEQVLAEILSLLHRIALAQVVPDAIDDSAGDAAVVCELAQGIKPQDVQLYYQIGVLGQRDMPLAPDSRAGLEMVLLRMLAFKPATSHQTKVSSSITKSAQPSTLSSPKLEQAVNPPVTTPVSEHDLAPPAPDVPRVADAVAASKPKSNDWTTVVPGLKLGGFVKQLATNCSARECSSTCVRLMLAKVHASLYNEKLVQRLNDALNEYYGCSVKLIINIGEPEAETPAFQNERAQQEKQSAAQREIEEDATLKTMIDTFDGQIVSNSVQPLD